LQENIAWAGDAKKSEVKNWKTQHRLTEKKEKTETLRSKNPWVKKKPTKHKKKTQRNQKRGSSGNASKIKEKEGEKK